MPDRGPHLRLLSECRCSCGASAVCAVDRPNDCAVVLYCLPCGERAAYRRSRADLEFDQSEEE